MALTLTADGASIINEKGESEKLGGFIRNHPEQAGEIAAAVQELLAAKTAGVEAANQAASAAITERDAGIAKLIAARTAAMAALESISTSAELAAIERAKKIAELEKQRAEAEAQLAELGR